LLQLLRDGQHSGQRYRRRWRHSSIPWPRPALPARLRWVAQAVERVLSDQDLVREHVANIIRDFINHERQHMAMEERVVFPAALNALRPKDWANISLRLADRYDPFYQPGFEERFNRVRRNILKMEEEAEAERA